MNSSKKTTSSFFTFISFNISCVTIVQSFMPLTFVFSEIKRGGESAHPLLLRSPKNPVLIGLRNEYATFKLL